MLFLALNILLLGKAADFGRETGALGIRHWGAMPVWEFMMVSMAKS